MSSRDCLRASLNHTQPDRVPVDFGAGATTGIHCSVVAALREHYGLEPRLVKVHEPYQMLGLIEEDLREAMGVDVVGAGPLKTIFGFANDGWKEWTTPWGQTVLVSELFNVTTADTGDVYIYPEGDTSAPASGHMPASSFFFDTVIREHPEFDEDDLKAEDNLEEFRRMSDAEVQALADLITSAAAGGCGVMATFGGTALGDIALVPAPYLKNPKGIRDVAKWYMALLEEPEVVHEIFDRQSALAVENMAALWPVAGDAVDAVFLCGADFGTQISTFCSPEQFDDLWLPYYKRMNDWIHANTSWKTFKHSCGAIWPMIPRLIEAGFDILNPVQCSATGMDPHALKNEFGTQVTFWGGGVDTQHTLPFGTPEEVRAQVLERLEIFAPGGGFVFNAIHNVQAATPTENMVAMLEGVKEFNRAGA